MEVSYESTAANRLSRKQEHNDKKSTGCDGAAVSFLAGADEDVAASNNCMECASMQAASVHYETVALWQVRHT
eukprot:188628-Amphidinium_carterae.1